MHSRVNDHFRVYDFNNYEQMLKQLENKYAWKTKFTFSKDNQDPKSLRFLRKCRISKLKEKHATNIYLLKVHYCLF